MNILWPSEVRDSAGTWASGPEWKLLRGEEAGPSWEAQGGAAAVPGSSPSRAPLCRTVAPPAPSCRPHPPAPLCCPHPPAPSCRPHLPAPSFHLHHRASRTRPHHRAARTRPQSLALPLRGGLGRSWGRERHVRQACGRHNTEDLWEPKLCCGSSLIFLYRWQVFTFYFIM